MICCPSWVNIANGYCRNALSQRAKIFFIFEMQDSMDFPSTKESTTADSERERADPQETAVKELFISNHSPVAVPKVSQW